MNAPATTQARWAQVHRAYSWGQCTYCGRASDRNCPVAICELCGTAQCHGNGMGNGCCAICYIGYLPGWSRSSAARTCGYKGCEQLAVCKAPRVRSACAEHAASRNMLEPARSQLEALRAAIDEATEGATPRVRHLRFRTDDWVYCS